MELTQIFLNFLNYIRNILPEINITLPHRLSPGVSQTCWDLTIGFYGKHLTFKNVINTTKLFVDLLKMVLDTLMNYLYLHHIDKCGSLAVEMYDFLYHSFCGQRTTFLMLKNIFV